VVSKQRLTDSAQGFLYRRDLDQDIGAIPVLLHHLLQPSDLPFDAPQPPQVRCFDLRIYSHGLARRRNRAGATGDTSFSLGYFGRHASIISIPPCPMSRDPHRRVTSKLRVRPWTNGIEHRRDGPVFETVSTLLDTGSITFQRISVGLENCDGGGNPFLSRREEQSAAWDSQRRDRSRGFISQCFGPHIRLSLSVHPPRRSIVLSD